MGYFHRHVRELLDGCHRGTQSPTYERQNADDGQDGGQEKVEAKTEKWRQDLPAGDVQHNGPGGLLQTIIAQHPVGEIALPQEGSRGIFLYRLQQSHFQFVTVFSQAVAAFQGGIRMSQIAAVLVHQAQQVAGFLANVFKTLHQVGQGDFHFQVS